MNLQEMKLEYETAKEDQKKSKTKTAQLGIRDALYKLKKKIDAEENRINSELDIHMIDGVEHKIPKSFNWWKFDKYTLKAVKEVIYLIDMNKKYDNDQSYHWHHYVWIPQTKNKYAKLCVRTLGGDRFGDRYFLSVTYYKHPADPYPYLEKRLDPYNRTYKPHADYILKELGLLITKDTKNEN